MFNVPVQDSIRLIPCAICTAPFDPATLPAHVYDPYHAFFKFTDHASICPSCFAEELAKRNRPPSRDPNNNHFKFKPFERARPSDAITIAGDFERADSGTGFVSEGGIYTHRKANSITTISRSASTSRLGSETRSIHHRKVESLGSLGSHRDFRRYELHRRGMSADQIRKSMETLRRRNSELQRYSPPQPTTRPRSTRPSTSQQQRHSPPVTVRNSPPTPSTATMTPAQRSSTSHESGTLHSRKSSEIVVKSQEQMKRKVSFRQGTPEAKAYNPMSPPRPLKDVPLPRVSTEARSGIMRNTSTRSVAPRIEEEPNQDRRAVLETPRSFHARWKARHMMKKKERQLRKEVRKERQRQRKKREDVEKGIGLDLFCTECRIVVRTQPEWKEGSCCALSSICLLLCTGPLCLWVLLPSSAPHIKDARGTCPHCSSVLSEWNRRTNTLTVHTWAGFADPLAQPSRPSTTTGGGAGAAGAAPRPSMASQRSTATRSAVVRSASSARRTIGTASSNSGGGGGAGRAPTTATTTTSENAPTTAGSSNFAGSSNPASSGADTFGEQAAFEQPVRTPAMFRDLRTGELIELETVGRAIG